MTAKKVLVIDDSIMIRKMVKSILAGKYDVLEASDGKSGLDAARRAFPDLILLDFVMPKYNGYQTLQAIRRVEGLQKVPVIMISGLKEQVTEHVPEPFTEFDFLEKPFEADVLVSRIQNFLIPEPVQSVPESVSRSTPAVVREVQRSEEPSLQMIVNRLTSTETLLVQGIENLIQREVVARFNELNTRIDRQDKDIETLNQRMEKISEQIDHQNKGLMLILRELKSLQGK
ncbi:MULTISPECIES: PleD family two-component system response regulator [Pseudanabaena]|uniref:Response regulator n=2 Tax=Pseudanabaena TaxID=1152 RepID=A0A9X4MBL4_9CYAN|nr:MULTISPECIES: response regulator [Pseudanabaena]MDG3496549.1 response regulator [Pseudanabaena catenata USMAC16]TYQ31852.1 response regulator [Pseudanabaena sp. UWO310]